MLPWFLADTTRLAQEREAVSNLSRTATWLVGTEWRILDGDLCLDAVIQAHSHNYEVRAVFPALFPDAPITVRPLNMQQRVSTHQYGGADGPLCLEWGPDNWHRDVSVAHMLESAFRLFDIENPLGQDRPEVPVRAPSRHKLTAGQELRSEWARWYVSPQVKGLFATLPLRAVGSLKFSFCRTGDTWTTLVHEISPPTGDTWKAQIPANLPGAAPSELDVGIWFKTDIPDQKIVESATVQSLQALLADMNGPKYLATDGSSPIAGFQRAIAGVLISSQTGQLHLFLILSGKTVIHCAGVHGEPNEARAPAAGMLGHKTIGIVGMGSVGSKIAVSLARMGARKFYLVDHDVLLPENLQRHALDWQSVTQHKANAMADAIGRLSPGAQAETCRYHLTGQETNAGVATTLGKLGQCDLIVDATGNPKVFNLLAAVVRRASRPMVWMEVFGGGIGGLIARSRLGTDPTPQDMRLAYLQFCTENPDKSPTRSVGNYAREDADGEVLVASDADVAIIAHHAVRIVVDCFLPPAESKFPHSMYLIGLAQAWVFEAPFATIPISTSVIAGSSEGDSKETNDSEGENLAFLLSLIQKR